MKSVKTDNFVYTAEATKDDFFMLWIICPIFVKQLRFQLFNLHCLSNGFHTTGL